MPIDPDFEDSDPDFEDSRFGALDLEDDDERKAAKAARTDDSATSQTPGRSAAREGNRRQPRPAAEAFPPRPDRRWRPDASPPPIVTPTPEEIERGIRNGNDSPDIGGRSRPTTPAQPSPDIGGRPRPTTPAQPSPDIGGNGSAGRSAREVKIRIQGDRGEVEALREWLLACHPGLALNAPQEGRNPKYDDVGQKWASYGTFRFQVSASRAGERFTGEIARQRRTRRSRG